MVSLFNCGRAFLHFCSSLMFLYFILILLENSNNHLTQYPLKWWFCSNDDPIFGNVNLGNADELWSSSKYTTNSPVKPFPISVASREEDHLFALGYGKMNDPASHGLQNTQASLDHVEYDEGKNKPILKEQV